MTAPATPKIVFSDKEKKFLRDKLEKGISFEEYGVSGYFEYNPEFGFSVDTYQTGKEKCCSCNKGRRKPNNANCVIELHRWDGERQPIKYQICLKCATKLIKEGKVKDELI